MLKSCLIAGLLAQAGLLLLPQRVLAENLVITTLEWPPYTSTTLPKGGATTALVQQVFEKSGLQTTVQILPWKRAIAMAKNDAATIAYFPGYHCRHVDGFVQSGPIGSSPLGFAENTEAPITWQNLDDIGEQKLKIGTVLGYANTDEFDEKAGTGWLQVVPAKDDLTNLRKLLRQRVDAAVIDKFVLSYLLATEPSIANPEGAMKFDEKPLEEKTLYLCFTDDEKGRALRDQFNASLDEVDIQQAVDSYFLEEF